jgi:hypothetical protein
MNRFRDIGHDDFTPISDLDTFDLVAFGNRQPSVVPFDAMCQGYIWGNRIMFFGDILAICINEAAYLL